MSEVIYLPDEFAAKQAHELVVVDAPVQSIEVPALRVHQFLADRPPPDRLTFTWGMVAGLSVALVLVNFLPRLGSGDADQGGRVMPKVAVISPDLVMDLRGQRLVVDDVRLPTVVVRPPQETDRPSLPPPHTPMAAADERAARPPAPVIAQHAPAQPPVPAPALVPPPHAGSAKPSASFAGPTVLYQAAPTAAPPATQAPAVDSPAATAPVVKAAVALTATASTILHVVSIPSNNLALISSKVDGQMMVSPYKIGQTLPDGRVITGMDPASGTVATSSGSLKGG